MPSLQAIIFAVVFFLASICTLRAMPLTVERGNQLCKFMPQSQRELQEAAGRLVEIIDEVSAGPGTGERTLSLLQYFMKLQAHTPIPLRKYVCAEVPDSPICNLSASTDRSRMRTLTKMAVAHDERDGPPSPNLDDSLIDIYSSTKDHKTRRIHTECEWSFLRPNCVFDPNTFPSIICKTKCQSFACSCRRGEQCLQMKGKRELIVMETEGCDAEGKPLWRKKIVNVLPLEYGVCGCKSE